MILNTIARKSELFCKFFNFACEMDIFSIIGIAIALSFDSYAASVSCGLNCSRFSWTIKLLIPFSFAFFQALLPLVGYFTGVQLIRFIDSWDHWLAFGLLLLIGGNMIREALKKPEDKKQIRITVSLIIGMSLATSIDALATGFSLGLLHVDIWLYVLLIFVVTFLASAFGLMTGKRFQTPKVHRWAGIIGGIILIAIGAKVAISHMIDHGMLS
jgi:putative Mn2+ efflux pump MntP